MRAMDKRQIEEWQREVQKPKKARCVYEVSDVFSGENVSDDNVRLVHVENSHKLRMYALFKTQLQPERYLLCVENKQERMLLACFRAGVLPLRIETGRYEFGGIQGKRGIPIKHRVCLCCLMGKVEDEIHFLLECPMFQSLRIPLLQAAREALSDSEFSNAEADVQKFFCSIMGSNVKDYLCRAVARFVKKAYALRVEVLGTIGK